MLNFIRKIISTSISSILKIQSVVVSIISCFCFKNFFLRSIFIFIIVIILFTNDKFSYATSNVIYPNTSHLYHGNIAQNKLRDQFVDKKIYDSIFFGNYDQDGDISNGKEPVEWIVLEKDTTNREVILISKYILECMRFNGFSEPVTWENSSLRKYLNEELINEFFDIDELKCVLDTYNYNPENVYNNSYSGENTVDKLYIPSIEDMYKYFTDVSLSVSDRYQELLKQNVFRISFVTPHAMNNGVRIMGVGQKYPASGNYLLRTKAPYGERIWYNDVIEKNFISFVSEVGEIKPNGTGINSSDDGIRIMLKVKY